MPDTSFARLVSDRVPLIPVLHVDDPNHAEPLLEALVDAGVSILEVTLRSDCALEVIGRMARMESGALVGAGTVTRGAQLAGISDAGAAFGVGPALTADLAAAVKATDLPFLPGACTPSEALFALEQDFSELKFFPADLFGGIGFLDHVRPLYPTLRFCPTGGISDANANDYLALDNVFAVGGAFLAQRSAIAAADWSGIASRARQSVANLRAR